MHWIALRLPPEPSLAEEDPAHGAPATQAVALNDGPKGRLSDGLSDGLSRHKEVPADALADGITALGWWALQFTPKVAQLENEGEEVEGKGKEEGEAEGQRQRQSVLVLEVSASERLFGGRQQLLQQIFQSNKRFANVLYAQAATSLIAIAKLQIKPSAFLAPSAAASLASSLASSLHTGTSASANANASARRKPGDPRDSLPNNLPNRSPKNLPESLPDNLPDSLPLTTLAADREHLPTLARIGCTTWGQLRALPRGGVVRRFGAALLDALDRAYGDKPELYPWLVLPEVLEVTLELQAQVETAPALMFSARRLLTQMQVWLQMRQCGVLAFELGWTMDARRNTATTGALTVRTAEPTRDMAHLQRLLAEHLARLTLPAPVLYLHLRTLQVEKLGADTASLLLEDLRPGDSLHQLLERLSARLGATQVRQLQAHADHRPERMQTWQSASNAMQLISNYSIRTWANSKIHSKNTIKTGNQAENHTENQAANQAKNQTANQTENQTKNQRQAQKKSSNQTLQADALYPTWLLAPPLKLPVRHGTPQCAQEGGPLTLLAGPQRVEAGWWAGGRAGGRAGQSRGESARAGGAGDRAGSEGAEGSENGASPAAPCALRDYFLARSEQMGLLWIYRERLGGPAEAGPSNPDRADAGAGKNADWYLHGLFA